MERDSDGVESKKGRIRKQLQQQSVITDCKMRTKCVDVEGVRGASNERDYNELCNQNSNLGGMRL